MPLAADDISLCGDILSLHDKFFSLIHIQCHVSSAPITGPSIFAPLPHFQLATYGGRPAISPNKLTRPKGTVQQGSPSPSDLTRSFLLSCFTSGTATLISHFFPQIQSPASTSPRSHATIKANITQRLSASTLSTSPRLRISNPIIMVSPSPKPKNPASPAQPTSGTSSADSKKPNCWTDKHEADLKGLAARGEDARSIIELMETDYPCLKGKLTEEWIQEKIKDVGVTG